MTAESTDAAAEPEKRDVPAKRRTREPEPAASPWSPLTAGEVPTGAADPAMRTRAVALPDRSGQARFLLVRRLLWLAVAVVGGGVLMLASVHWTRLTADDVSDFVSMIFTAVMTLAAAAVGFYFGGEDHR